MVAPAAAPGRRQDLFGLLHKNAMQSRFTLHLNRLLHLQPRGWYWSYAEEEDEADQSQRAK